MDQERLIVHELATIFAAKLLALEATLRELQPEVFNVYSDKYEEVLNKSSPVDVINDLMKMLKEKNSQ